MNVREHVLRIVYQELVRLVWASTDVRLEPQTILMAGLQGSGKTTTTAKLARYFQKKGMKVGVICADTFRPGAFDQISTLCSRINVPCFGNPQEKDALKITREGLEAFGDLELIIVDTQGRHALEADLIREIIELNVLTKATHRWLVIDAALGQQASEQARRFHEAIGIDGVIITKMDGTAKGGGAMSAVAETKSGIAFIGSGETIEDLERFDPDGFISRLLGMGDLKALVERASEAINPEDVDVNSMMKGKFTLRDMYKQLEALNKMGPLKQIMGMLPLGNMQLPEGVYDVTSTKMVQVPDHHGLDDGNGARRPRPHQQFPHATDRPWGRCHAGRGARAPEILQDDAAHPQGAPGRGREIQHAAPDEALLRNAVR